MKKLLVILLVAGMMALLGTAVLAEGRIGINYGVSGSGLDRNGQLDLTGYSLNGEYLFSKFKVGFDYGIFKYESDKSQIETDSKVMELIGGYRLVEGDTSIYLTLGYYNANLESTDSYDSYETKFTAPLIGLDFVSQLSDKLSLESSIAYSLFGANLSGDSFEYYKIDDESLIKCGIKLSYQLTAGVNLNVGWKHQLVQAALKQQVAVSPNKSYSLSDNLFTVGATYNF